MPNEPLITSKNLFPVVGIGASAGGLDAFKQFLQAIPEDSGMAYVLVQHLDPTHESLLPELLQKVTRIPVEQITDEVKIAPDHIYIIPSNKMLIANDGVLKLSPRTAKKMDRHLPIDLFFQSLSAVHQSHSIGVILSGTGSDGTRGLKAIKDQGGITFAQDESSAAYDGMPRNAVQAGVVDFVLPPEKIPQKLLDIINIYGVNETSGMVASAAQINEAAFKQILSVLRLRKGTDFAYYKQTTIRRRILRRMALNKSEEPAAYLQFIRENKQEQDILYQDLLISVTEFFRDKKVFDNLCESIIPRILKSKSNGEPVRVWVAGCSTGEEAFSIAICFKEVLGGKNDKVQIFATDISEPAIAKARIGLFKKNDLENVSPQRLHDFFSKQSGEYRVNKDVREMCVFAVHNFLKDPPFGKVDFISCRNVLIYMESYLQKKALTTFHYALNPKGFMLLGKSETISSVPDLFAPEAKSDKLYSRKDGPGKFIQVATQRIEQNLQGSHSDTKADNPLTDIQRAADDVILRKYMPDGVVVNEVFDIVNFRGKTSDYLEQLGGKPSHNLLKLAKRGLAFDLRNILHQANTEKKAILKESISLHENIPGSETGIKQRIISIEAIPLNTIEPHYLILFHETSALKATKKKDERRFKKDDKDLLIQNLEQQLVQTHEDMRAITEVQESAIEELQSANEELLSSSEELQSLNEELETSKEEIQSTNEELTILNQELLSLTEQVTDARDYAEAIVATVHDALVVLDRNFRIKSANQSFYKKFAVNKEETEGVVLFDLGNKQWNISGLHEFLHNISSENGQISGLEVAHNFPLVGEKTVLLNASRIIEKNQGEQLILLSISDITQEKNARKQFQDDQNLRENQKDEFISIASHEMKTPLTTAKAYLQMLELALNKNDVDAILYAKKASEAVDRLNDLIGELLDVSKIRLGKLDFKITTFNFNDLIDSSVENMQLTSIQHSIVKTGTVSSEITGDQYRLQQVLINLLSNAIKYSPGEKKVYLTISQEKEQIKVSVKDTGIGIAQKSLDQIFDKYHRIEEHAVHFQGLGIGLFISKEIIQRHHGEIWAESEEGMGSTFYFTLPLGDTKPKA